METLDAALEAETGMETNPDGAAEAQTMPEPGIESQPEGGLT